MLKRISQYFENIAADFDSYYDQPKGVFNKIANAWLRRPGLVRRMKVVLRLIDPSSGKKFLDVGCGSGRLSIECAKRGAEVVGIDISKNMIMIAKEACKKNGAKVDFIIGDVMKWIPNGFDYVVALGVVEYLDSPKILLNNMLMSVKSGGKVIFSVPSAFALQTPIRKLYLFFNRVKCYFYTKKMIYNLVSDFKEVRSTKIYSYGPGFVVQLTKSEKAFSKDDADDAEACAKVTIGLCVKNEEATIGQAIDSVLNQNFPRELMELIIVDGYSKDKTLDIIKRKLKTAKISYKIYQEKKGLGCARQMVVNKSGGKYIIWVDADMILSNNFLRDQVSFMEKNSHVGIGKGRYGILEKRNLVAILEDIEFALSYNKEGLLNTPISVGTSGCIYRVEAVKKVGGFNPSIYGAGEDTDIENKIKKAGWAIYITPAIFYEKRRDTWKALWNEYYWHGVGGAFVFKKSRESFNLYKFLPPIAIFKEFLRVPAAYKLTRNVKVILMPLHYIFKNTAWILGFMKGYQR